MEYYIRDAPCYQNNVLETVLVEIDKDQVDKDRNGMVVYRLPDTDIDLFISYMTDLLDKIKSERKFLTCLGDHSISLLNAEMLELIHEFTKLMCSYSMFPCTTKPTRVTTKRLRLLIIYFVSPLIQKRNQNISRKGYIHKRILANSKHVLGIKIGLMCYLLMTISRLTQLFIMILLRCTMNAFHSRLSTMAIKHGNLG